MTELTFSVDEDILERVRNVAEQRNTTVAQMLRDFLNETAARQAEVAKRRADEFKRVADQLARPAGGLKFNREDCYDRPILHRC